MKIQSIIIIILVILLIGTISLFHRSFSYYNKYQNFRTLKYVKMSDIYDELKSGDIILYKCNTISLPSVFLTHVYFSHIGIIIKNNKLEKSIDKYKNKEYIKNDPYLLKKNDIKNDLFISETNPSYEYLPRDYNRTKKNFELNSLNKKEGWRTKYGSDILPLLVRLKYYPGDCFLMRLNKPLCIEMEEKLIKYANKECPYPTIMQGLSIIVEQNFGKQKTNARHCFQHVGYLLDKIGITNNISDNGIYSICKKVANIYQEKLNNGYRYETPIKILYDVE
jgi:hypothetical protein